MCGHGLAFLLLGFIPDLLFVWYLNSWKNRQATFQITVSHSHHNVVSCFSYPCQMFMVVGEDSNFCGVAFLCDFASGFYTK